MIAEIIRLEQTNRGTIGVLRVDKRVVCVTLELPYICNSPNISCIPSGSYQCERKYSPKFGNTYEIVDVPGRSHILFHAGNTISDTSGCVLLGTSVGAWQGQRAIVSSKKALRKFLELADETSEFRLIVTENY